MWLLFVPILIILAIALMLGGLVASTFWLLGSAWPWLLIALGAWLFWHEDGRHRRGSRSEQRGARGPWITPRRLHRAVQDSPRSSIPDPRSSARSSIPDPRSSKELPIDVQVKVEQIRRKVDVLLGYADRFPPFSQDLYLVRQTASDYLPRTINAFLSLPVDAVDRPLHSGGRTAREELKGQLDLLDSKLDDIAQDLQR